LKWIDRNRDQDDAPRSDGTYGGSLMETEAMQANNAEPVPLRASPHRVGTLVIRFIGLLFLSVTALALVWMR
jgi:hypothetical protein